MMHNSETSSPGMLESDRSNAILEAVNGARVVLIGESSHGVAEFAKMRIAITDLLRKEAGFNVLALESGICEAFHAWDLSETFYVEERVRTSMHKIWRTAEHMHMANLVDESSGQSAMTIIGIDIRPVSASQHCFIYNVLADIDPDVASILTDTELFFKKLARSGCLRTEEQVKMFRDNYADMSNTYQQALECIDRVLHNPCSIEEKRRMQMMVAKRSVEMRLRLLRVIEDQEKYLLEREQAMAENLAWVIEDLFPDSKAVVWTHNLHACKAGSVTHTDPSMHEIFRIISPGCQTRAFGGFMLEGSAAWNNRNTYEVRSAACTSEPLMEEHMRRGKEKYSFQHFYNAEEDLSLWWNKPCHVLDWGVEECEIIPSQQYDGAFVAYDVHPPEYM